MWPTLIVIAFVLLFVVLPHYWLQIPEWIHLPVLFLYYLWIPRENLWFRATLVPALVPSTSPAPSGTGEVEGPLIYAVHPHGVYGVSTIAHFISNPRVTFVGSSVLFYLPIVKDFVGLAGAIPAHGHLMADALSRGRSLVLCPGGLRELPGLDPERTRNHKLQLVTDHMGFIRLARAANATIVPVYAADEVRAYSVWIAARSIQSFFLSQCWYPWPVLCWPLWPRRLPSGGYRMVYGTPITNTKDKSVEQIRATFYGDPCFRPLPSSKIDTPEKSLNGL